MSAGLQSLSEEARSEVLAALAAVETADAPVPGDAYRGLADPSLRGTLEEALQTAGRTLIARDGGWLSGYRNDVADRLAEEGLGVLRPKDRAVLALVLLHTVAIPRARGRIDAEAPWTEAEPTTLEELERNRHLTQVDIKRSLRRLRSMGVLRYGHRAAIAPGPQFLRLTEARSAWLWEELLLLCQPDGMLAILIRRRRAEREREEAANA